MFTTRNAKKNYKADLFRVRVSMPSYVVNNLLLFQV